MSEYFEKFVQNKLESGEYVGAISSFLDEFDYFEPDDGFVRIERSGGPPNLKHSEMSIQSFIPLCFFVKYVFNFV